MSARRRTIRDRHGDIAAIATYQDDAMELDNAFVSDMLDAGHVQLDEQLSAGELMFGDTGHNAPMLSVERVIPDYVNTPAPSSHDDAADAFTLAISSMFERKQRSLDFLNLYGELTDEETDEERRMVSLLPDGWVFYGKGPVSPSSCSGYVDDNDIIAWARTGTDSPFWDTGQRYKGNLTQCYYAVREGSRYDVWRVNREPKEPKAVQPSFAPMPRRIVRIIGDL